jgi:hypothetical protein
MAATFAGFAPTDLAAYFGVSPVQAQGIINLATNSALSPAEKTAVSALDPNRFKPGATTYNQGFGDIVWGLQHLAEHPAGSTYHGDFNVVNLVANIATGGLYGVVKAGLNIVTGGKVVPNLKDAAAVTGVAGSVLQPTIGTNKTLIAEIAVVGASFAAAPSALLAAEVPGYGALTSLGPLAGLALAQGKTLITNALGLGSAPAPVDRGVSGNALPMTTTASTYYVSAPGAAGSSGGYGSTDQAGTPGAVLPSSALTLIGLAAGALALLFLIRRSQHAHA